MTTRVYEAQNCLQRMLEKTVLITGSTDGIGQYAALELARMGARVILHGRSPSRGKAVLEQIKRESKNDRLELVLADFASLDQVRRMADEIRSKYERIDVLVNNAGVYLRDRQISEDGIEMTFAVNHLSPFLLTNLLLRHSKNVGISRIVVVSSMVHQNSQLDFSNLHGEKRYDAYGAYAASKLANLLFTYQLAERLKGTSTTVNAIHPGVIATKLLQAGFGSFGGRPVSEGADRILFAALSPKLESVSGKYFVNDVEQRSSSASYDRQTQKDVWTLSEKLTGLDIGDK